jgi:hypothetical protein
MNYEFEKNFERSFRGLVSVVSWHVSGIEPHRPVILLYTLSYQAFACEYHYYKHMVSQEAHA